MASRHPTALAGALEGSGDGVAPWLAFDFLNSVLVINGTLHFSTWLRSTGVDERWYGLVFSFSSALLLVGLPILGAFLDRRRHGRRVVMVTCAVMAACAFAVTAIGHWPDGSPRALAALVAFGLMNTAYQASLVGYNWLLVHLKGVRTMEDVRRVSGLGEAAGAAGSVVGALLGIGLLEVLTWWGSSEPRVDLFVPVGALFLVSVVLDLRALGAGMDRTRTPVVRTRYRRVWIEWLHALRRERGLRHFFLAFFFFANAILTVQFFLPIHMQQDLGYGAGGIALAVALALGAGTVGGVLYARLGARHDTRRAILLLLGLVAPGILALGWATTDAAFLSVLTFVGAVGGALWAACRAHLIALTKRTRLGRNLAFFAVFERTASVLGPVVWGAAISLPSFAGRPYALATSAMTGMIVVGFALLAVIRDVPPA
jgi:UMF1 family MFS transporter